MIRIPFTPAIAGFFCLRSPCAVDIEELIAQAVVFIAKGFAFGGEVGDAGDQLVDLGTGAAQLVLQLLVLLVDFGGLLAHHEEL